ncbi:MAG: mitochondrial fission ELM1 family protein [Synergistaceae bacterium]|jgi:mitochondrial fission protein ELM1|nr:mitochondrial fission ELM1 family protein [Synergistaceae bacterium]
MPNEEETSDKNYGPRDSGNDLRGFDEPEERPARADLKLIVILKDKIRGHVNQSRGVAAWLVKRTGAQMAEIEIPELKRIACLKTRRAAAALLSGDKKNAREWLAVSGGDVTARTLAQLLLECGIREGDATSLMLLSAGSMPAFYNIALGAVWRCMCTTIMTPSVIGTDMFDFAIVPDHDYPDESPNILPTVGAPNLIVREELGPPGEALLKEFPPRYERRWGLLIGGDDKNYRLSASWMHKQLGKVFREAEKDGVDLYISTSRRTSPEAENALRRMVSSCGNVRFFLAASADPFNAVPGILGACDEMFVTDDSVNMVSETVTAGHRVILLKTERAGMFKKRLQLATAMMVESGLLPKKALWGAPRFDRTYQSFRNMGLLTDFVDWIYERRHDNIFPVSAEDDADWNREGFNEARRAADWILSNLPGIIHPEEQSL